MAAWKQVSMVYSGGTMEFKKLYGKRVRARTNLTLNVYDAVNNRQMTTNIKVGAIGFVANPHPQLLGGLLLAFPKNPNTSTTSIETLQRSNNFEVIIVNEPTFKQQFEIEM
jgi:hypothetical protein